MTFAGRLRIALIAAALLPTLLITVIALFGVNQQVKQIEYRQARSAISRFSELLTNTVERTKQNLNYIANSRGFQLMEMGHSIGRKPDPQFQLPLLTLDFVEYWDSRGKVILSVNRPGLVGQDYEIDKAVNVDGNEVVLYRYENDRHGSHPAMVIILPTGDGILYGGIYLDGSFNLLVSSLTNADITDIATIKSASTSAITVESRLLRRNEPYRVGDQLHAQLLTNPESEYYLEARFHPTDLSSLYSDFFVAIAAVTVFSLLLVIPAGLYFSAQTRRKLSSLSSGADRVASGNFSDPVEVTDNDEFGELASSFNQMVRQLAQYQEKLVLSQKIAAWQTIARKIAHEVKNPLTPIAIAADDLSQSYRDKNPDFGRILYQSTSTIKQEIDRLKKMIREFSDFARMPAPDIDKVKMSEFIDDLSLLFKNEISQQKLQIISELRNFICLFDPDQIRQLSINLIKNSLEAGSTKCRLEFSFSERSLTICFEDNGCGLPDELLKDGITPYFSTKDRGSGLGLVICQRIVFDHGGSMKLENMPEGGARVKINLPQENA